MRTYPVGRVVFRLRRGNVHLVTLYVVEQSLQTATETESEKDIQRGREREEMPRASVSEEALRARVLQREARPAYLNWRYTQTIFEPPRLAGDFESRRVEKRSTVRNVRPRNRNLRPGALFEPSSASLLSFPSASRSPLPAFLAFAPHLASVAKRRSRSSVFSLSRE